jgi:hypothetical protein
MTINEACEAVEAFLRDYEGGGARPASVQVRPSGDDLDVIKIYADLAGADVDSEAWRVACADAIAAAIPDVTAFRLDVRAETDRD